MTFNADTLDCAPCRTVRPVRPCVPVLPGQSCGPARGRFGLLLQRGQLGLQARADPGPIQAQQDATHPRAALEADRTRHPRSAGGGTRVAGSVGLEGRTRVGRVLLRLDRAGIGPRLEAELAALKEKAEAAASRPA